MYCIFLFDIWLVIIIQVGSVTESPNQRDHGKKERGHQTQLRSWVKENGTTQNQNFQKRRQNPDHSDETTCVPPVTSQTLGQVARLLLWQDGHHRQLLPFPPVCASPQRQVPCQDGQRQHQVHYVVPPRRLSYPPRQPQPQSPPCSDLLLRNSLIKQHAVSVIQTIYCLY